MLRNRAGDGAGRARGVGLFLAVAVGALVLASCSSGSSSSSDALTVYSGQHVQTTQKLIAAFEKQTGITANLRSDDEDSTLANTPSRFNSPHGKWVGVTARVSVIGYNTSLLSPRQLPKSVMDLADPQWKGKIGIAGSETDFQPIVTSIARMHGEAVALQWLQAVKANAGSQSYPDNETLVSEVNRGQVALGVINQYYWYREKAQVGEAGLHSAIATSAPHDPGYVIDVSGAGILKSTSHEAEAQRFLAFLTSKTGQEIIAHSESYEYPVASGVTTAQPETPFDQLQPNSITIPQLGTGAEAIELLQEAQLL
jgi:iron(III) transport system substrate-binding protein